MSFDLAVLALDEPADAAAAGARYERCTTGDHVEGDLDERVVAFYEELRARFPDHPPYAEPSPWASTPLNVGIDHVIMSLSSGAAGDAALRAVLDLAAVHRLLMWDPQSGDAHPPGALA